MRGKQRRKIWAAATISDRRDRRADTPSGLVNEVVLDMI
jgi:hypothetical protein